MTEEDMFRALEVRIDELEKENIKLREQLGKMIYWARMANPPEKIRGLWCEELQEAAAALKGRDA